MATFANFIARVRRELEESSATVWEDSSLLSWANDGFADLALKTRELVDEQYADTIANTQSYELPDYTIEPVAVSVNDRQLTQWDRRRFVNKTVQDPDVGTPLYFSVFNNALYLYPTPASTSTGGLRFWRLYRPTPFTSVSQTVETPFGGEHDDAVAAFVKSKAFEQVGDFDAATYYDRIYARETDEAIYEGAKSSRGFAAPREVY